MPECKGNAVDNCKQIELALIQSNNNDADVIDWPIKKCHLSKLDIGQRSYTPEGVHFAPNVLAKQPKESKRFQGFIFPSCPGNDLLCPVKALREYKDRTASLCVGMKPRCF